MMHVYWGDSARIWEIVIRKGYDFSKWTKEIRLKFIKLEKEQRRGDLNIFKESGNIKAFPVLYKSMSTCFLNLREKFVILSKTMWHYSFKISVWVTWLYMTALILTELFFSCFGFQGHHFMVATLPYQPYIYMNPTGFTADGSMKYEITGYFPEVFHNLQVSYAL